MRELENWLEEYQKQMRGLVVVSALQPDPIAWKVGHVTHGGKQYLSTGKWANRISDGVMGLEFETDDSGRVWVYRDGIIAPD